MPSRSAAEPRRLAVRRLPLLALGAACLLSGLAGGLARLGVPAASPTPAAASHGIVMTLGFLGTLIALERAVALGRLWGYLAPALCGLGGLAAAAGVAAPWPALLLAAAAAWLVATYVALWQRQPALHITVQGLGALAWWGGAIAWLPAVGAHLPGGTGGVPAMVPWLVAFVVLTIAGERLELARVVMLATADERRSRLVVLSWSGLILAGPVLTLVAPDAGYRVLAVGLLVLAAWLVRHDIARHTVRATGLTRYMAVCLLAGYVWMSVAGVIWLVGGAVDGPGAYDAAVHAVFLGFAMSMVFGHAPVILPAVLRVRLPYHRRAYVALVLLHLGLVVRLVGGDLLGYEGLRIAGGVVGVVALLGFVVGSAVSAVTGRGATPARRPLAEVAR